MAKKTEKTEKKSKKEQNINYYEILVKLEETIKNLKNVNENNFDIELLKAKELIFAYPILKDEYITKVKNFHKEFKTKEYEKKACNAYEQLMSHVAKFLKQKLHAKISYHRKPIPEFLLEKLQNFDIGFTEFSYKKNSKVHNASYIDIPKYYIYSSVMCSFDKPHYWNEINAYNNINDFYMKRTDKQLREMINLPNDLAYYISTLNVDRRDSYITLDTYIASFIVSAMREVLHDFRAFINSKIEEEFGFKLPELPVNNINKRTKKHVIKYDETFGTPISVNDKPIDLYADIEQSYIEELRDILFIGRKKMLKQHASTIRNAIRKIIGSEDNAITFMDKKRKSNFLKNNKIQLKKNENIYEINEDLFDIVPDNDKN